MPKPDFVTRAKELRLVEEITQIVEKLRVPQKRIDDAADYRREVVAEALVCALEQGTPHQAVKRAEQRLIKLFRELS